MIPGMNPRQMQKAMQRMGIQQTEVDDAQQVIIKCKDRQIIIDDPAVSRVNMMGQETWQVIGKAREESLSSVPEISDDDVKTVVEQTGCSEDEARSALEKNNGDIAETIMELKK